MKKIVIVLIALVTIVGCTSRKERENAKIIKEMREVYDSTKAAGDARLDSLERLIRDKKDEVNRELQRQYDSIRRAKR